MRGENNMHRLSWGGQKQKKPREDRIISIYNVLTQKNADDIVTKSLPISKVETFRTVSMGTGSTLSAQARVGVLEFRSNYCFTLI